MRIEVLDFYPKEKNENRFLSGDIKIRLPDLKINVLGIYACRRADGRWLILMPCRSAIDREGQKVKFPIVHFDEADHKVLMAALYEAVPVYVEQRLKDTENPLVFPITKSGSATNQQASQSKAPPDAQTKSSHSKAAQPGVAAPEVKSSASAQQSSSAPKARNTPAPTKSAPKVFKDLPARKSTKAKVF